MHQMGYVAISLRMRREVAIMSSLIMILQPSIQPCHDGDSLSFLNDIFRSTPITEPSVVAQRLLSPSPHIQSPDQQPPQPCPGHHLELAQPVSEHLQPVYVSLSHINWWPWQLSFSTTQLDQLLVVHGIFLPSWYQCLPEHPSFRSRSIPCYQ